MGWFARIFGDTGIVRFEGMSTDGRSFTGKTQIESFGLTRKEIEEKLKQVVYVNEGIRCSSLKITGYFKSQIYYNINWI